jgi:hypothetical protein
MMENARQERVLAVVLVTTILALLWFILDLVGTGPFNLPG